MPEEFTDELISAYLDGELSGEDRLRVERVLAEDPAARRLLEELRSLSTTLHALPEPTLGPGFKDQVMRAAERAMLACAAGGGRQGQRPAKRRGSVERSGPNDRRRGRRAADRNTQTWRRWAWPALAIAAALLVMAYQRSLVEPAANVAQRQRDAATGAAALDSIDSDKKDGADESSIGTLADQSAQDERLDSGDRAAGFREATADSLTRPPDSAPAPLADDRNERRFAEAALPPTVSGDAAPADAVRPADTPLAAPADSFRDSLAEEVGGANDAPHRGNVGPLGVADD